MNFERLFSEVLNLLDMSLLYIHDARQLIRRIGILDAEEFWHLPRVLIEVLSIVMVIITVALAGGYEMAVIPCRHIPLATFLCCDKPRLNC